MKNEHIGLSVYMVLPERHRAPLEQENREADWFLVAGGGVHGDGRLPRGAYDLKMEPQCLRGWMGERMPVSRQRRSKGKSCRPHS